MRCHRIGTPTPGPVTPRRVRCTQVRNPAGARRCRHEGPGHPDRRRHLGDRRQSASLAVDRSRRLHGVLVSNGPRTAGGAFEAIDDLGDATLEEPEPPLDTGARRRHARRPVRTGHLDLGHDGGRSLGDQPSVRRHLVQRRRAHRYGGHRRESRRGTSCQSGFAVAGFHAADGHSQHGRFVRGADRRLGRQLDRRPRDVGVSNAHRRIIRRFDHRRGRRSVHDQPGMPGHQRRRGRERAPVRAGPGRGRTGLQRLAAIVRPDDRRHDGRAPGARRASGDVGQHG